MAGFFQQFAGDVAKGFLNNPYLRDYTHASKTFVTNAYAYAPKYKFLFHVYFDINSNYINAVNPPNIPVDHNYGLAVKSIQLPKYSFDVATMNQYNRKRLVQTKIKYDPVNITVHDDNNGLMSKLWYAYYTYYYKDGLQQDAGGANTSTKITSTLQSTTDINKRNLYNANLTGDNDWGYIGETDNDSKLETGNTKFPFFRGINIYGFNQHNFILYRLINPLITSFSHDTYNYSEANGVMEHQMTVDYETVKYYTGAIDGKNPGAIVKQFGDPAHYDTQLSPLAQPGSNSSILGQGGLVDSAGGVMNDLASGNYLGALKGTINTAKTFNNPQTIINAAKGDAISAGSNWLQGTPNRNNLFNFPSDTTTPQSIQNNVNNSIQNGVNSVTNYVNNVHLGNNGLTTTQSTQLYPATKK
jgi:hypothetical protein